MNKFQKARLQKKKEQELYQQLQQQPKAAFPAAVNRRIGVFLHQSENAQAVDTASDRIRGTWVIKNSTEMEIFRPEADYDAVIFHVPCKEIAKYGRIKILDICDKIWEPEMETYRPDFLNLISPIDAIIVPTQVLRDELAKITDKPIFVITDGHDIEHYATRNPNIHSRRAEEVVWFGYGQNAHVLAQHINYIKSLGLKLKVIAQKQDFNPLQFADVFVKWDEKTYIKEISKSDFAFLPPNHAHKSNNKEITALFSGIPVAKTREDIARLMFPDERKKEMQARIPELASYDAKYRAKGYEDVVRMMEKSVKTIVYTSNFGKYDASRKDIKVFSDSPADIFRHPVMNAKIYKIMPHKYFQSPISIFMDANIFLNVHPKILVDEFLGDADIALFKHPKRSCIYEEHAPARLRVIPELQPLIDEQVRNYRAEGMPEKFGLMECGMLIRKNNDIVNEFNERWWAEVCRYTNRDQMSFPYIWWKMKDRIKIKIIEGVSVREHKYFKYIHH